MKIYCIPMVYTKWGLALVKANSLSEAIAIQNKDPKLPPDSNAEYVSDSEQIDFSSIEQHNELTDDDILYLRYNC